MRNRKLLSVMFLFFLCPFMATNAHAQTQPAAAGSLPFNLKPLQHNVYAAIDDAKGDAGANAGFVIGDDGVLVVDTFENPAAAKQLLAEIRKLTKLPVKYVVNTHYHLDHVAGNAVFREAGAVVIAQRNVPAWIHTENLKFFGKDIKPEQKSMVENLAGPDLVYDAAIEITLGSVHVVVKSFPGHTGGDSVVVIPGANVVFCGDLFWKETLPNLIDASTGGWIATLDQLTSATPAAEVFVPGHGEVGNAKDVAAFRDYLKYLREIVAQPVKDGKTTTALVDAAMPALKEKYGKWNFFDYFAAPDILDAAAELRGDKKIPQPPKSE